MHTHMETPIHGVTTDLAKKKFTRLLMHAYEVMGFRNCGERGYLFPTPVKFSKVAWRYEMKQEKLKRKIYILLLVSMVSLGAGILTGLKIPDEKRRRIKRATREAIEMPFRILV